MALSRGEVASLSILVIDDDPLVRGVIRDILRLRGHELMEADGVATGVAAFQASRPDVAIVDYRLDDGDGLDLVSEFSRIDPRVPVVLMTGEGSIPLAVSALRRGAYHFITKPFDSSELVEVVEGAAYERMPLLARGAAIDPLVGRSEAIRRLALDAHRLAAADTPVLITGEAGTGKRVLARWLHQASVRRQAPFAELHVAGLSREGLETELFGEASSRLRGASSGRRGLIDVAQHGALLVGDLAELDPVVQGQLLKVIDERRFRRVGGRQDEECDVRLLAATRTTPADLGRLEGFRQDLLARLTTCPLVLPPLRERLEDVPALAQAVISRFGPARKRGSRLSPAALDRLQRHGWPGNIGELRHVLERAVLLSDQPVLEPEHLRFAGEPAAAPQPAPAPQSPAAQPPATEELTLRALERVHILRVFQEEGQRVAEAALRLGMPRSTLYQKLREYGVELPKGRKRP